MLANEIGAKAPLVNNIALDPPLTRTLGLVERRGRVGPPALKVVRQAPMAPRDDDR
jgi:hypothetical protein